LYCLSFFYCPLYCLFFYPLSIVHCIVCPLYCLSIVLSVLCIVCPSLIDSFFLPLFNFQTFLIENVKLKILTLYLIKINFQTNYKQILIPSPSKLIMYLRYKKLVKKCTRNLVAMLWHSQLL
jgi:hypothetical protein